MPLPWLYLETMTQSSHIDERGFPGWCICGSFFVGEGFDHDLGEPVTMFARYDTRRTN